MRHLFGAEAMKDFVLFKILEMYIVAFVGITLFVCDIQGAEIDFYSKPDENIYLVVGQNVRLEWNFNAIGNEKVGVAVTKLPALDAFEDCGSNSPTTGFHCLNATGQVVLKNTYVTKDLEGKYEIIIANGNQLRSIFYIHVLDIQVDVNNGKILQYHFPDPGEELEEVIFLSNMHLPSLYVTVGEEYSYKIKTTAVNVSLITCWKRINNQQKANSWKASPSGELDYHSATLTADIGQDVVIACHVVIEVTVIYFYQKLKIDSGDDEEMQSTIVSVCGWGIPLLMTLILVSTIIIVLVVIFQKEIRQKITKHRNDKTGKSGDDAVPLTSNKKATLSYIEEASEEEDDKAKEREDAKKRAQSRPRARTASGRSLDEVV